MEKFSAEQPSVLENTEDSQTWFKQGSLEALRQALSTRHYPGYPTERIWLPTDNTTAAYSDTIPPGPWEYNNSPLPTDEEQQAFMAQGYALDSLGRPEHPWLDDMFLDPTCGVVTGKGFYWRWGPNYTVDPIVIRHDLSEPHVLLIRRKDTGDWALPGGFLDSGETEREGAIREAWEEAGINLHQLKCKVSRVYEGPLADLRTTAHAWPETTAFSFELKLDNKYDRQFLMEMMANRRWRRVIRSIGQIIFKEQVSRVPWKGRDDASKAAWVPVSKLGDKLFGSHRLLIELALQKQLPS